LLKVFRDFLIFSIFILLTIGFLASLAFSQNSEICLECHDTKASSLMNSPHELYDNSALKTTLPVSCQSCHDGWQDHIDDPSTSNITTGNEISLTQQAEICSRCHITPHQTAMVSSDPHQFQGISCSSCHTIHDNHNDDLVKDDRENYCLVCHEAVAFEFSQRSFHPLESGNIKCTDCHGQSLISNANNKIGFDWGCQNCHDDLSGPYLYEHPVTYNHLVEGESCIECHEPHGSPNDRLLKQPGNGTCNQCHGTPPGHLANHNGLGSRLECVQCHTEIHGSYINRLFLDPDLGVKFFPDCYQSGCHGINN
jgi:DmsE family decaheme c-type cytochrome